MVSVRRRGPNRSNTANHSPRPAVPILRGSPGGVSLTASTTDPTLVLTVMSPRAAQRARIRRRVMSAAYGLALLIAVLLPSPVRAWWSDASDTAPIPHPRRCRPLPNNAAAVGTLVASRPAGALAAVESDPCPGPESAVSSVERARFAGRLKPSSPTRSASRFGCSGSSRPARRGSTTQQPFIASSPRSDGRRDRSSAWRTGSRPSSRSTSYSRGSATRGPVCLSRLGAYSPISPAARSETTTR